MSKVRIGIVGLGAMGELYADAIAASAVAEIGGIADLSPERLARAEKRYDCAVFADFREMYEKPGLDMVIVTLPDFLHRDAVVQAAVRGLHILVEKPFATSMADADAMVEAIEKHGVKCMVEFFNRWSPPFTQAKQRVSDGELGEVVFFSVELNDSIWVPTQMLKWAARSSPGWFLMSHTADLAFWITGQRPVSVQARGVRRVLSSRGVDTFDLIEAVAEHADGTIGRFGNCWVLPEGLPMVYELKMRIVGSKAAIDIDTSDQEIHLISHERVTHPISAWGNILGYYVGHPYTMLQSFVDNIIQDTQPVVGYQDGWNNTKFLEAVHRSLDTGKVVRIDW